MNIENVPLIVNLNKWVEELPPEHRSEAYRFAESFYGVGVKDGIFASTSTDCDEQSKAWDGQVEYPAYLQAKAKKNKVQ